MMPGCAWEEELPRTSTRSEVRKWRSLRLEVARGCHHPLTREQAPPKVTCTF